MEYECGPLLLYSQDKIRLMDFLSDVFEFEVDSHSDCAQQGFLNFKIIYQENNQTQIINNPNNGIVFSFKVRSEQELKEIMNKYNFFLYRKNILPTSPEKIEFIQFENKKILIISDIDQRLWRFEFELHADL